VCLIVVGGLALLGSRTRAQDFLTTFNGVSANTPNAQPKGTHHAIPHRTRIAHDPARSRQRSAGSGPRQLA
jgi:hypothetical protein